ncbi:hypothetical protein KC364_g50 [Hortaea werneckii]|nr:hypothetical protein KC364_g50 [Hortaea werneckii]
MEGQCQLLPVQAMMANETETEDDEVPDYHYLGDPHLIDMMSRLKAFRDSIYLPKRISFQEQRETFEQLAAEVVHTHDELQCFFAGEISLLFRRAAKKLLRGRGGNEISLPMFRVTQLSRSILALLVPQHTAHTFGPHVPRCAEKRQSCPHCHCGDVERASVIRTQLPDIESVYLYDKTESRHNHVQQKLTATQGDVTYVPGMATFVSEDAWSLATTASMLRRQYSASSERRVFLVMRLGFWTVPGMRMMARSSEWDAQEWYQELHSSRSFHTNVIPHPHIPLSRLSTPSKQSGQVPPRCPRPQRCRKAYVPT